WIYVFSSRNPLRITAVERRWIVALLITVSVLGFAYFSNFILGLTSYITGPLIYSSMIYFISYIGFRFYNEIFGMKAPLRKLHVLSQENAMYYIQKLDQIFAESQPYLDPGLNL